MLAAAPVAGGARAAGLVAERAFPPAGACYARRYDAAHLARHPGQVVTGLHLWGSSRDLIGLRAASGQVDPELTLTLRVDFSDGASAQGKVGCAEVKGRIRRCGREASCSGGFAVEALPDGRLEIVNDDAASREPGSVAARPGFSPDAACPPAGRAGRFVPPDAQNRVFRLERLPLAACTEPGPGR
ncbi:hypothetical protein VQ02_06025 [Methylobacterium variabile]|jgi:hypothetical protein|uniref:Uncharacterized protein n=2 Tax=Methylobacterium variabile TaxID=298794 RepID=A0A0J6VPZ9_9HYPH|nr:hypothetical protein VQ02_06025 [Methylobacterium variabile]